MSNCGIYYLLHFKIHNGIHIFKYIVKTLRIISLPTFALHKTSHLPPIALTN